VKLIDHEIAAALAIRQALGAKTPLCADANWRAHACECKALCERTREAKLDVSRAPLTAA